jgi:hypothetical protein
MADNSLQGGTDSIRDIDRSGSGPKTQVFQLDHGGTGATESLTSRSNPLPVGNNAAASGTLTASDAVVAAPIGDGSLISGASTAGSVVAIAVPQGMIAWTLLIKGYVSGTIYTEASANSTNGTDGDWVEIKGRRTGTAVGVESVIYAMVSNGYYRGNCAGFTYVRARLIGGTGPTIAFTLSNGQGATFLNSGIPAGSSAIGTVAVSNESSATFRGRATTFRALGRATTVPRRLFTLFNATGSGKVVHMNLVAVDLLQTAVIASTVVSPVIRIYKITAAPTGGTALTKVAKDNLLTSNASVTLLGDASADGTNSATALAATTAAGAALTQEFAPRIITAAGYEMFDRSEFLDGYDILCRPGEGICLSLDLTLATQDPATNNWIVAVDWYEI